MNLSTLTIEERERLAYAEGFTETAELFRRIADLERLLAEVLEYIEDGNPPSPSGDWVAEVKKVLP